MRLFGIILAGGMGRRMGGTDKAMLMLAGQPLIAHVSQRLQPQVEHLAISANGDPARFAALGLPVLPDDVPMGPLSGILSGLVWAQARGADALISAPVDGPFLPGDLAPRLLLAGLPAMASSGGHDHPVCAIWPTSLAAPLRAFLASGVKPRVTDFLQQHATARAPFPDDGAFANINTPANLATAAARLA